MGSNKEAQAARNAADRRLRQRYPADFEFFMRDEHEVRGLTWNRRATPEERARRDAEEKQAKAKARIEAEAAKAGLSISFNLPVETEWDESELVQPVEDEAAEYVEHLASLDPMTQGRD
jgi:hypothetical protein